MGKSDVDFRGNREVGGTEDVPGAVTPGGPTIDQDGNEAVSGSTSGGQETEGEYDGDRD